MDFTLYLIGWISSILLLLVISWLNHPAQAPTREPACERHQEYQALIRLLDEAIAPIREQEEHNRNNEQHLAKLRADGCPVVRLMYPSDGLLRRVLGPTYINQCIDCKNEFDAGGWPHLTQCPACSAAWWQHLGSR